MPVAGARFGHTQVFSPLLLSGLAAWYDASDTTTITAVAGAVSQWNDKSGNGRHVTQATAGKKPTTGVHTINSRNVLQFVQANASNMAVASVTIAQPLTVLAVVKSAVSVVVNEQILGNSVDPQATVFVLSNNWETYAGSLNPTATAVDTNAHQLVCVFNGASSVIYLDGTSIDTDNPGTVGRTDITISLDDVGGAWSGDIAEIAIKSGAITATERTLWNTYCARWGL